MGQFSGMTGFARATGQSEWGSWVWEAKSVNGRALDVRVALPPGFDALERSVKAEAQKRFERGSLQVSLRLDLASPSGVQINEALLKTLIDTAAKTSGAAASFEGVASLLGIKGVVETGAANGRELGADESVITQLMASAVAALEALGEARRGEGRALSALLLKHVGDLESLRGEALVHAASQPALLKEKLERQLTDLGARERVDADRLAAETALTVARADVREELDRLGVHLKSAREMIASGSPAGRKLDFLAQELNREANTLCSKSASLELTQAGLGLKGVIDQFKEQAANVE